MSRGLLWPWFVVAAVAIALVSTSFNRSTSTLPCDDDCVIVLEGDSLTVGLGNEVCDSLSAATCINSGVSGWRGDQMVEAAPGDVDSHAGIDGNVVVLWSGTNDLYQGLQPSDAYEAIIRYTADRKAAGWDHVVVVTLAPEDLPTNDVVRAFNDLIRENSAGADSVLELDRDPQLTGPDRARYYSDGIHHTAEGAELVASIFVTHLTGLQPLPEAPG